LTGWRHTFLTLTHTKRNPLNKLLQNLKIILKRWIDCKYVSSVTYSFLNTSNAILPRAYDLPKIHKAEYPLRIIVSSIGSPLHSLALFLHKILIKSLPPYFSQIKNSLQLKEKLSNLHIPDDCCLASFDVISLFINVPIDLVVEIVEEKWPHIETNTTLPLNEFILSIKFVLESTFFHFNNRVYKQTFGAPMGLHFPLADLILQKLESSILNELTFKPTFYYRYVDDRYVALAIPRSQLNSLLNKFNSFHHRLKFTMEIGCDGDRLDFFRHFHH